MVFRFNDLMTGLTSEIAGRASARSSGASLAKILARNFVAGRLRSASTCIVDVCEDGLQYKFHHATHGPVKMAMFYRDVHAALLDMARMTLTFRVRRTLRYFGSDYDPLDETHVLSLQACSGADALKLRQFLETRIEGLSIMG